MELYGKVLEGVLALSLQALLRGEETSVSYVLREPTQFSRRFYSGPGIPVHDIRPIQNLPLLRLAFEAEGEKGLTDHGLLKVAKEHFDPIIRREVASETSRMKIKEVKYREAHKSEIRISQKEAEESSGAGIHTDISACMIFAKDLPTFSKLTDHYLPTNNSAVARLIIKAANPDTTTRYPANLANVVTMGVVGGITVPWVNERQIGMNGWQQAYDETHNHVNRQRRLDQAFGDAVSINPQMLKSLSKLARESRETVPRVNDAMSRKAGTDKLIQERRFYMVRQDDGKEIAFVVARDKLGEEFCFHADEKTGFYRTENSLRSQIGKATEIRREDFYLHSMMTVEAPDLSKSGVLPEGARPRLAAS